MKHFLRLILVLLFLLTIQVKAQHNKFFEQSSRSWNLTEQVQDTYLLLGNQALASGLILAVTDSTGKIISENSYPGYIYQDAAVLSDKGIAVTGNMRNASSDSIFLMRFDSTGNLLWAKIYYSNVSKGAEGMYISPSQNNGYWLVGQFATGGNSRQFIIKTDEAGGLLYSKGARYDSNGGISCNFGKMIEGTDNSCYFTFGYEPGTDPPLIGLFRTDSVLNFKWCKGLIGAGAYGYLPTPVSNYLAFNNHHVYISWYTPMLASPDDTVFASTNLSMLDSTGSSEKRVEWKAYFQGCGNSIYFGKNGSIFMGGQCNPTGSPEAFILKLDSSWNQAWSRLYGPITWSTSSQIQYLAPTKDNGVISAGTYFIKTDSNGNSECTDSIVHYPDTILINSTQPISVKLFNTPFNSLSVVPVPTIIADTTHVYCYLYTGINEPITNGKNISIFPNPNNGKFTLQLPINGSTYTVEISNVLGEKVLITTTEESETQINISGQSAGIYLYRVTDNNGKLIGTGKFIIRSN